jgi:hypothetical protein
VSTPAQAAPRFWPTKGPEEVNEQGTAAAGVATRDYGGPQGRPSTRGLAPSQAHAHAAPHGHSGTEGDASTHARAVTPGHQQRGEAGAPGHRTAPPQPTARMSPTGQGAHVRVSDARASGVYPDPMRFETGPMHATWDIPLDGLPKIARLQPIKPRRWPYVFLGVLAGAAAVPGRGPRARQEPAWPPGRALARERSGRRREAQRQARAAQLVQAEAAGLARATPRGRAPPQQQGSRQDQPVRPAHRRQVLARRPRASLALARLRAQHPLQTCQPPAPLMSSACVK